MTTTDVGAVSHEVTVVNLARTAKEASRKVSSLSTAAKDSALEKISVALERHFDAILAANDEDVRRGKALVAGGELSQALFQRLMLNPKSCEP